MSNSTKISDYYPICKNHSSTNPTNDDLLSDEPIHCALKRKCDSNQLISAPLKHVKPTIIQTQIFIDKPYKFFKEKQKRRLEIAKLVESSPIESISEIISNENIPSSLIQLVDHLNLCPKYNELFRMFNQSDRIVTIMYNRQEECTFSKLKRGVEKIVKKQFTTSHFAQIVTIYPNAYELSRQQNQLIIKPNVCTTKMTPYTTTSRKSEFKTNLALFVKKAHANYLASLNEPIIINDIELIKWHPSFEFPDIPEAKLPVSLNSMNERKSLNDFWVNKRLKLDQSSIPKEATQTQFEERKTKIKKGILKGLSQEFLDKIKNKETNNLIKEMTRKPETEKKIVEIKRLPELIRIIHSHFTTEKKKAILLSDVIQKCLDSSTSFSGGSCSDLIQLTNELLPDWLLILNTTQGKFVKINKETVLKSLFDRLDRCVIKLKET